MQIRPNPNAKLDELLYAAKQGRLPHEREAWLNLAFFLGQQYSEWHQEPNQPGYIRAIPRTKATKDHPRPVINKIMHFVRTAHSDALQDRPTGDVLPPTSDYMDRSDSQVAKAWIEDQSDATKTNYDAKLSRAVDWAMIAGTGWLKWCYGKDGLIILPPSFFEVYLDPYAKMYSEARYVVHSQFMDVEQVYELYGKEVKPAAADKADEAKTALLRGMGAAPVLNGVIVNEVWAKPSRRYKRGLYGVWTGRDQLYEPGDLPYEHLIENKMLPFTQLGVIERPDSAYYMSPVQFLRPPQMELNDYHAQKILNRKRFANGKWLIPKSCEMDEDPDDSPSQILRFDSSVLGDKPELVQGMMFPDSRDGEWLEQGMMHVVGQGEVSLGQAPGRVEAAKALEMLKEADAGALAVLRETIKSSNDQGWFQALQLARQFQKTSEMVTSYSKEGLPEVKHFKAGEMKAGHRIRTTMTTGLARSRANKQDLLVRLWDSKVITDPEVMADMLDMPLPSTVNDKADDIMRARNENLILADDKAVEPGSWDDHEIHLRELNAWRKTSEFEAASPGIKQKAEHHASRHETLLEIQLARQAKLQIIAQGGVQQTDEKPSDNSGGATETPPTQEGTATP